MSGVRYPHIMSAQQVGWLFREWRHRRRVSQLGLALHADISARHLSFIETGRSHPSRDMVLHLAEHLDTPLRQRIELLLVAGYAPVFRSDRSSIPRTRAPDRRSCGSSQLTERRESIEDQQLSPAFDSVE